MVLLTCQVDQGELPMQLFAAPGGKCSREATTVTLTTVATAATVTTPHKWKEQMRLIYMAHSSSGGKH